MNDAQRLKILGDTNRTVFSTGDLRDLWEDKEVTAQGAIKRMVQKELVVKLAKGYYSLKEDFNQWELANLIISPSYISLNSALFYHSVSFQVRNNVASVATWNHEKEVGSYSFKYYAMKDDLFFNLEGIGSNKGVTVAHPERAILDCFYFGLLPNIDNEDKIKRTYLEELMKFYPKTVQDKASKIL